MMSRCRLTVTLDGKMAIYNGCLRQYDVIYIHYDILPSGGMYLSGPTVELPLTSPRCVSLPAIRKSHRNFDSKSPLSSSCFEKPKSDT